MNLFMDNVPNLAIAPIIKKLDEMLCPTSVSEADDELVTKIAGESAEKIEERKRILSKLAILEKAARTITQYMRPPCKFML
jgi:hypothetical protein